MKQTLDATENLLFFNSHVFFVLLPVALFFSAVAVVAAFVGCWNIRTMFAYGIKEMGN